MGVMADGRPPGDKDVSGPRASADGRWPLHVRILVGLAVGVCLGALANYWFSVPVVAGVDHALDRNRNGVDDRLDWVVVNLAEPIGQVFLRLVLMVVLPLIFSALVLG